MLSNHSLEGLATSLPDSFLAMFADVIERSSVANKWVHTQQWGGGGFFLVEMRISSGKKQHFPPGHNYCPFRSYST